MGNTQLPNGEDHPSFDAMCSEVEDFETLPTVTPVPAAPVPAPAEDVTTAPLDKLIFGGLVSP